MYCDCECTQILVLDPCMCYNTIVLSSDVAVLMSLQRSCAELQLASPCLAMDSPSPARSITVQQPITTMSLSYLRLIAPTSQFLATDSAQHAYLSILSLQRAYKRSAMPYFLNLQPRRLPRPTISSFNSLPPRKQSSLPLLMLRIPITNDVDVALPPHALAPITQLLDGGPDFHASCLCWAEH